MGTGDKKMIRSLVETHTTCRMERTLHIYRILNLYDLSIKIFGYPPIAGHQVQMEENLTAKSIP